MIVCGTHGIDIYDPLNKKQMPVSIYMQADLILDTRYLYLIDSRDIGNKTCFKLNSMKKTYITLKQQAQKRLCKQ